MTNPTPKRRTEGPVRDIQVIHIEGRRWFDAQNGNTYHSVTIYADGTEVTYLPKRYGYEDHYQQTAQEWLSANGFLPGLETIPGRPPEALWRYAERTGLKITTTVSDVRKKDL